MNLRSLAVTSADHPLAYRDDFCQDQDGDSSGEPFAARGAPETWRKDNAQQDYEGRRNVEVNRSAFHAFTLSHPRPQSKTERNTITIKKMSPDGANHSGLDDRFRSWRCEFFVFCGRLFEKMRVVRCSMLLEGAALSGKIADGGSQTDAPLPPMRERLSRGEFGKTSVQASVYRHRRRSQAEPSPTAISGRRASIAISVSNHNRSGMKLSVRYHWRDEIPAIGGAT